MTGVLTIEILTVVPVELKVTVLAFINSLRLAVDPTGCNMTFPQAMAVPELPVVFICIVQVSSQGLVALVAGAVLVVVGQIPDVSVVLTFI